MVLTREGAAVMIADIDLDNAGRTAAEVEADLRVSIDLASREALSKGITTVHDAGSPPSTIEVMKQLMREDLPAPVAPAMSRWGIFVRFTSCERPWTSLPRATERGWRSSRAAFERSTSPSTTKSRTLFGTSTPIAERPGIGAMMRTSGVASA